MKNNDYHNLLLESLPESYKIWFEEDKNFLKKNISKDSSVLYVGCGDGREINYLLGITDNIIGIDHDAEAIERCKKNFSNFENVKFILTEAEEMPFEENSFDFVISMGAFMNFGEKRTKILNEMKRVLKKEGKIILDSFSEKALDERLKVYRSIFPLFEEKENGKIVFPDTGLGDNVTEQFSKDDLVDIFTKVDLKIEEIKEVSIAYICLLKK